MTHDRDRRSLQAQHPSSLRYVAKGRYAEREPEQQYRRWQCEPEPCRDKTEYSSSLQTDRHADLA